jgi:hypothetical protein
MFSQAPPAPQVNEDVHLFIDPAAGGPGSDYAILSITRHKGLVTVRSDPAGGQGDHAVREAPVVPRDVSERERDGRDERAAAQEQRQHGG